MSRYTKNNEWLTPSAPPKRIAVGPVLRFARELAPARWRLGVAAALSLLFSASAAFIPLLFRTVERSIRAGEADAVALALLGYGFWHVYFKPKPPCEDGSYCARPQSAWTTKAVLWLGLAVAILALTIDWWAPWFY